MKYCSRCVMPETAELLTFDEHGVCSVCRQIEYKHGQIDWAERGKAMDELFDRYRGKQQYDCIVPFSGGKDCTFTLWYLVKVKKLQAAGGALRPRLPAQARCRRTACGRSARSASTCLQLHARTGRSCAS